MRSGRADCSSRVRDHRACVIALSLLLACVAEALPASAATGRAAPVNAELAGRIFTVAGALRWTGPDILPNLATRTSFRDPAISVTPDGGFLITDPDNNEVLRAGLDGSISVVAGGANDCYCVSGDGGPATSASLSSPGGVAALPGGGFLIADTDNDRVRRVWPDGHISTVAGSDNSALGDGGPATSASLSSPQGVAALPHGGFLIADTNHNRIRRVWSDGRISTVAGNGRERFSGDGGLATRASVSDPEGVAALPHGGFLIADTYHSRVRRVGAHGRISTVAGNGRDRVSGNGGPARSAAVAEAVSVAPTPDRGFLIGTNTSLIGEGAARRVWPDGHISSIADGGPLYGDGGPAGGAALYNPEGGRASVAALPGGGALIGYGATVRLIVGRHGTRLLGAAIRALAGVASPHAYRARVVLTKRAHITIRVYDLRHMSLVAIRRRYAPAGESSVTVRLGGHITRGLYAIDLTARRRAQATRAEQYAYLGGSLTRRSISDIESLELEDDYSDDPNAYIELDRCHKFGPLRVDCAISGEESYVEAVMLTRQGQLRTRTYSRPSHRHRKLFKLHPRWQGPAFWEDLGAAWSPGYYSFYG